MIVLTNKALLVGASLFGAVVLSSCEGESRPFTEAVEVQSLGLTAIDVAATGNVLETITINSGQAVQMSITGIRGPDERVALSASNRQWQSSAPGQVRIDEDGVVVGVSDGEADITVSLGGLESAPLTVTVNNATLQALESIRGVATLERCLPSEYFAVGRFSDASTRPVDAVTFSLQTGSSAQLIPIDSSSASVNATTLDAVTLTATQGELAPLSVQLTTIDTLRSLELTPDLGVLNVDETIDFTATGTYSSVAGGVGNRTENITASVAWSVLEGATFASVINSGANKGRVTGLGEGPALVQATCGTDVQAERRIDVRALETSESDVLSFEVPGGGDTLRVALGNQIALRVSRGTEFDSDDVITSGLQFSFNNTGTTATPINEGLLAEGIVSPLVNGGQVNITAFILDSNGQVEASGTITVQVGNF